jgi:hypothetical protein
MGFFRFLKSVAVVFAFATGAAHAINVAHAFELSSRCESALTEHGFRKDTFYDVEQVLEEHKPDYFVRFNERGKIDWQKSGPKVRAQGALEPDEIRSLIFIYDTDGHFYATDTRKENVFHHSSFNRRQPVFFAGHLFVRSDGTIVTIDSQSGHYQPSIYQMATAIEFLQMQGMDVSQEKLEVIFFETYRDTVKPTIYASDILGKTEPNDSVVSLLAKLGVAPSSSPGLKARLQTYLQSSQFYNVDMYKMLSEKLPRLEKQVDPKYLKSALAHWSKVSLEEKQAQVLLKNATFKTKLLEPLIEKRDHEADPLLKVFIDDFITVASQISTPL